MIVSSIFPASRFLRILAVAQQRFERTSIRIGVRRATYQSAVQGDVHLTEYAVKQKIDGCRGEIRTHVAIVSDYFLLARIA